MRNVVLYGDCLTRLKEVPDACVQTCVTSPPYFGLRNYGVDGQIGAEMSAEEYIAKLVTVFHEVRRVLRDDGTLWCNLGDSYARKNLQLIPARVALALQTDGWCLRSDIVWAKASPMPESVVDRPTRSHEYVFLFAKNSSYFYDANAIREPHQGIVRDNHDGVRNQLPKSRVPGQTSQNDRAGNHPLGRNKRTVWSINAKPYKGAHFAVFPPKLPETCIRAGSRIGDLVLDPFCGSGTTLAVAKDLDRDFLGIEINESYRDLIEGRTQPAMENADIRAALRDWMEEDGARSSHPAQP